MQGCIEMRTARAMFGVYAHLGQAGVCLSHEMAAVAAVAVLLQVLLVLPPLSLQHQAVQLLSQLLLLVVICAQHLLLLHSMQIL